MEFDLIAHIRGRCAHRRDDVALGIGDDAALLDVPAGLQLVACTDTLVAGVHFPSGTAPFREPADRGPRRARVMHSHQSMKEFVRRNRAKSSGRVDR